MNIHPSRAQAQTPSILPGASLAALLLLWTSAAGLGGVPHAQATPPITPSGLNTQVNLSVTPPSGTVQYDITGGTRPGGGVNLFHSFGDFNVPNNTIANFLNDSGLTTSNILGRVTGGNPSTLAPFKPLASGTPTSFL
jgi:large exoprotein involved in heme utilization and adhesion